MSSGAASVLCEGEFSEAAVARAAGYLRENLGGPASVGFAFVSSGYLPYLDEFADILRVDGHISEIVGSTGSGFSEAGCEIEGGAGFSVLALGADLAVADIAAHDGAGASRFSGEHPRGVVMLGDPYRFTAAPWLEEFDTLHPGCPVVGGIASGSGDESTVAVFWNGAVVRGAISVGLGGALRVVPAVSQGCRPIGEALPVTRADDNMVFSLGARPAYQVLESAFQTLSDREKSTARGNLFVGLASSEYVDEFKPGDFLIRNIIGADPNSGAVLIGVSPRVGQTLQYQIRDRASAHAEMRATLAKIAARNGVSPAGTLLFSCLGRGSALFGEAGHDAGLVQEILGVHPAAGLFCNGEIGPVAGANRVHGYTASCALIYRDD